MKQTNRLLYQNTDTSKYATFFFGILDTKNHQLNYCNAGHNDTFLFRNKKEPLRLNTGGIVLGFVESSPYEETIVPINAGDSLVLYSDGVTEAMNANEEEFGEERLIATLMKNRDCSSDTLVEKIIQAVNFHAGNTPQSDDITLVMAQRV